MSDQITTDDLTVAGRHGELVVRSWVPAAPRSVVLIAHGYGEHGGRYDHVARRLAADGAAVYAPDHHAHGRSAGEPALVESFDDLAVDLGTVRDTVAGRHPGLPVVVVGHSLGGLIVTRHLQLGADLPRGVVLSGPFVAGNPQIEPLVEMDPLPEVPIDPAVLSRDPAVGEAYVADPLVYHGPFKRPTLRAVFAAVQAVAGGPAFGDVPVLWVHGDEDALSPADLVEPVVGRLAGNDLRSHRYPGARHEVFNETNRDEVIGVLAAFVAEVTA
ncbi:MAG: lysophospholipase [Solirubrobacteraceae bacterium]|nr:lysophospholipase [Solirubrobacteraceae bacterium]